MAVQPGFRYVAGPYRVQDFTVTSADTFADGNPVTLTGAGRISEFSAVATAIVGIALSDSSESIGGKVPVLLADENTIFSSKIQTGVASSVLTDGAAFNIEKATDHFRLDTDSTVTLIVQLVPRGDGSSDAASADSSVWCRFLPSFLKYQSGGTVIVPAV